MKKIKISLLALSFLFAPAFALASIPVSGTLLGNTTWTTGNTYVVSGLIIPTGVTLTIPEGVVVKFSDIRTVLEINGNLVVNGTETNPSYFTSINDNTVGESLGTGTPHQDDWGNIVINEGGTAEINHSVIRYGGYTGWLTSTTPSSFRNHGGSLIISSSRISNSWVGVIHESGTTILTGNTFSENNAGISSGGTGSLTFNHNTFLNNTGNAVSLDLSSGLAFTHSNNTVSGGVQAGIILGGTTASNYVFEKDAVPYIIDGLKIANGSVVMAHPGAVFKFTNIKSKIDIYGKLLVEGSTSEPVYFTSLKDDSIGGDTNNDKKDTDPAVNDWEGIFVFGDGEANFNHSVVRYGGCTGWLQSTMASNISNSGGILNISNSEISHSTFGVHHFSGITSVATSTISENSTGIYAGGTGSLSVVGNTFSNNASPAFFDISGFVLTNANNTAIGTGSNGFDTGGTLAVDQTLGKDTMPYLFSGLSIPSGRTLTIAPGAVIKMASIRAQFFVAGTLNAIGTKEDPIYLTSINDNSIGGTTGTGNPQPADWAEMGISTGGAMNFNHAVIRYGGQNSWGIWTDLSNLANRGGTLNIQNSEIAYAHIGIVHTAGTTNISQSSIHDNAGYGINNATTVILNARNNYWGSLSGPTHASNPLGTGDRVSDYVNFTPYSMFDPTGSCSVNCYSNVMFLPGIMGSDLYDVNGNKKWLSDGDTTADYLKMDSTGVSVNNVATKGAIEEGGLAQGTVNVYKSFISEMRGWETTYGITATTTPYDWRLDYDTVVSNGRKLSNGNISYLIPPADGQDPYIIATLKKLASTSRTGKVTIIAHSQGGLITKALTAKLGNTEASKYIDKIIFVATPQLGTPEAMARILHGVNAAIPNAITDTEVRSLAQNMQSAYNLLPSEKYFTYVDDPVTIISTTTLSIWSDSYGEKIHWVQGMYNFMADTKNMRAYPTKENTTHPEIVDPVFLERAKTVHTEMDNWIPPTGVQFTTVAGWGMDTVSGVEYSRPTKCIDSEKRVVNGKTTVVCLKTETKLDINPIIVVDGDGTVVEPSAHFANGQPSMRYWMDLGKYNEDNLLSQTTNTLFGFYMFSHGAIFEVPQIRNLVENIFTNGTAPYPADYISTVAPSYLGVKSRLHFILHSPLTLEFYDLSGNHVGYSKTTGLTDYNIPGVEYERIGEVQWLSIPKDLAGRVVMNGIENGSFTLDIEKTNGNDVVSKTSFEGILSLASTAVTMAISPTQEPTATGILAIDYAGDGGAPDVSLSAKENDVVYSADSIPPTTIATTSGTLGKNGWYTSDVSATFSATDDDSGIKSTFYSTDKGLSWTIAKPLAISTEGTTTIQYYSIDNEGNKEATSTLEVKIDKTAPKATIFVDPLVKDLKVAGIDISGISSITNVKNTYTITDNAGHTTKLFFEKIFENKRLVRATLIDVQYDNAKKKSLPDSMVSYKWENSKNTQILSDQKIDVKKSFSIDAEYDVKKNITTVIVNDQRKKEDENGKGKEKEHEKENEKSKKQTQKFTGLRVIQLTVDKGTVGYEI